ncbi:MAG: hypothetical protein A2939_00200 [Parcubacteria group bacterium RIFCSPLOWO2_01_FULL_48_18]|nr:MAG: hypothetical protein A3J67_05845 [Parcubacteria group bacterium RIFCSPHIGHO2_02_FULL_48_10b]OHB22200.1 MAG: hypothetical protein A2939_00200 [Parcubacteria group bacterium RIFCSPLOWO2_01_FULL_48_18]
MKTRFRKERKDSYTAPPLRISSRTKEMIARHYLDGRFAKPYRKVAWVTSGAPVEILNALGFHLFYPENHGAICGVSRTAEEISGEAEDAGYSPDICSYARTDIGSALSGKTPVGKLPPPDILVACTNICQTVLYWYGFLAHHFKVPLILIDTPFIYTEASDHSIEYVKKQLEAAVPIAEGVAGKTLDERKLKDFMYKSRIAMDLWMEILGRGAHRPTPISAFDQFIHMAPIVEMRGHSHTIDFYAAMLKEVDRRIAHGIGAVKNERKRLLWDNLPIWHKFRFLSETLGKHGVVLAASTYTNAWAELAPMIDPEKPFESAARAYLHPMLNRGAGHKLNTMRRMIEKYSLDGVILHSDRSCKPYSIGQMDQRTLLMSEYGIPALLLEADHCDPRYFTDARTTTLLMAFIEMLGQ